MIALVLSVVGLGAGYFFIYPQGESVTVDTGFAEYLPADTVAVISLRDINSRVDNFPNTATGKFLSKETMTRILTDMELGAGVIQAYNAGYDKLFEILHNPAFMMVFGDDADLAVLPVDKSLFTANIDKALEQSLLLMATTNSADIIELFAGKILKKSVEKFPHGALTMTRITLEDGAFIFAYTDKNRLLVALDPVVIEKALQRRDSGDVLSSGKNFLDAVNFWEKAPVEQVKSRVFIQGDFIRQVLLEAKDGEVQRVGEYLQGISFIASVGGRNQDRWQEESMVSYVYDELDPLIRESVRLSMDSHNETLHLLKTRPLIYNWMADISTASFLEGMRTDEGVYADINAQVQQQLGVSLEDLVKSFGPQSGSTLNRIIDDEFMPLPEIVQAVQITNRELIGNVLNKVREMMSARGMPIEYQEVDGLTIYSRSILPVAAAQISIVLSDDMFYLSNGLSELKKIISPGKEAEKTKTAESVKQVLGAELSDKVKAANSGVLVLWPARLSVQLEGLAAWAVSMFESSRQMKVGFLKDELLRFLGSSEVIVFTSSVTRERGYGSFIMMDSQGE